MNETVEPSADQKAQMAAFSELVATINKIPFEPNQALAQTLIQGVITQALANALELVIIEITKDPDIVARAKTKTFTAATESLAALTGPRIQVASKINGRH